MTNRDNSRTPEAKARTQALKARRTEKRVITSQPFKAESILTAIHDHKRDYGYN